MTVMNALAIAAKCGVRRRTVDRWAQMSGFPGLAGRVETSPSVFGNGYEWEDVRAWLIETDRWDEVVDGPTGWYVGVDGRAGRKPGPRT